MAGLESKPKQHLDGRSLVPLFEGKPIPNDPLYWHFPHYQGEGGYPASAIRLGDFKLIHNYHQEDLLLFNLSEDPNETKNLAPTMPEVAKVLDSQLMHALKEVGAYLPVASTPEQKESQKTRRKACQKKKAK